MSFAFQILGMLKQQKEVVGNSEARRGEARLPKYENYADLFIRMLLEGC